MRKLKEHWKDFPHEWFGLLCLLSILTGLLFSRSAISLGILGLSVNVIINYRIKEHFRYFFSDKVLLAFAVIFFVYAFSIFNSENTFSWADIIKKKLPFLFLPLGFVVFRNTYARYLQLVLYWFAILVTCTCIYYFSVYIMNYEAVNAGYGSGKVLHLSYGHIRFSLIISFCIFIFYYLIEKEIFFLHRYERYLQAVFAFFLILFLHVIAVRSGLLAFYLCILFLAVRRIFTGKIWFRSVLALVAFLSLPVLAYKVLPSFRQKVNYVQYDIHSYLDHNNPQGLSDGGRILSVKNGISIGKDHFISGVGIGDLQDNMKTLYKEQRVNSELLPHNQFVYVFAATGITGALIFMLALLFPIFYKKNYRHYLIVVLYLIILSSCLTEATLEEQVGTGFSLTGLLLLYFLMRNKTVSCESAGS